MNYSNWAITDEIADALTKRLQADPPKLALDVGSGRSTKIFNEYCPTVSLEHDPEFYAQTLEDVGELENVDLRLCPLVETELGPWYDTELPHGIDFVLLDGPPGTLGGRGATLPNIFPHLARSFEIWVDDATREEEAELIYEWCVEFHLKSTPVCDRVVSLTRVPVA